MLTVIYNCTTCHLGKRVEYDIETTPGKWGRIDATSGKTVFPGSGVVSGGKGLPKIYVGDPLGRCIGCGGPMIWGGLKASYNEDTLCDDRCTHARGHECVCSCGGANHGIYG